MIDYRLPLDELPDPLPIEPLRNPFDVSITPPGSKSITCRAYVLAALANGESRIIRPLRAEDTDGLLKALCTLGATAKWEGEDVLITGVNGRFPRGGEVNLGDGGTPTRFMIACACLAKEPVVVDGSPRMRERPIAEGVDLLRQLGADIEYTERDGRLPVRITPSDQFKGGELTVGRTASSQFISAVILIAPWLSSTLSIRFAEQPTSVSYIELSIDVLNEWNVPVEIDAPILEIESVTIHSHSVNGRDFAVEIDASSAVYWLAARSLIDRAWVRIMNPTNLGEAEEWSYISPQPDAMFYNVVLDIERTATRKGEWRHGSPLVLSCGSHPDASMTTAVLVAGHGVDARLDGLRTLRVKETDRVAALANELTKVGCKVEIDDSDDDVALIIHPIPWNANGNLTTVDPVVIETYNDHRMAMAFAVLGLVRPGLSIRNPACVAKSYPGFWRDFATLYDG